MNDNDDSINITVTPATSLLATRHLPGSPRIFEELFLPTFEENCDGKYEEPY